MPTATERQRGHPGTTPASRLTRQGQTPSQPGAHPARSPNGLQPAGLTGRDDRRNRRRSRAVQRRGLLQLRQQGGPLPRPPGPVDDRTPLRSRKRLSQPRQRPARTVIPGRDQPRHRHAQTQTRMAPAAVRVRHLRRAQPAVPRPLRSRAVNLQARTSQRPRQRPGRRGAHRIRWRR